MFRQLRSIRTDREGQTLPLVAVMMVALLALLGLGIDLGMAYTARSEAQRVADSAALAGASAFLDYVDPLDPDATELALDRAFDYAGRNVVRNRPVDVDRLTYTSEAGRILATSKDVTVLVLPGDERVRVWIRRAGLPAWFSRLLGQDELAVQAMAAAQAVAAGSSHCAAPFAVPDIWDEKTQDLNGNRVMDFDAEEPLYKGNASRNPNEFWSYDPAAPVGDEYRPYHTIKDLDGNILYDSQGKPMMGAGPNATGYGSDWRHNIGTAGSEDNGLRIMLYPPQHVDHNQVNNWWNFWTTDDGSSSYNELRQMLKTGECVDIAGITGVGGTLKRVTGNRAAVVDDWYDLIDSHDKALVWNPDLGWPVHPDAPDVPVTNSRRIVSVPLVHPDVLLMGSNDRQIRVVDIVTLFLEDPRLPEDQGGYGAKQGDKNFTPLTGRIVHRGSGALGPNPGSFEKLLRLVE